jgi:protein-tyrosine phosphatase
MRILFVCMGNICRSPSAEGVFRRVLQERAAQLHVQIDSAGTHDYHIGEPPDSRALAAALRRGVDLSELRARQVADHDFELFDLILAMDEENLRELRARAHAKYHDRIRLLLDYAPESNRRAVPDPYYGGEQGFEDVLDLLEEASEGLVQELIRRSERTPR